MSTISRKEYAEHFGATVGDKIRLGNTDLYIEIEKDYRILGDETIYGGGKTMRASMGMDMHLTSACGAPDLVITNVTIVDAKLGVVKADIGIKDGYICGIGHAGNPGIQSGVTPSLAIGPATDAISGEHLILTAGGIDSHIHFICPQQIESALSNGVTTLFGGGIGPTSGSNGTTVTSGPRNLEMMFRASESFPVNVGFLGKGSAGRRSLYEEANAGAIGFKCHEDWGSTPAVIRSALDVADECDMQVAVHTDTLNEAGYVEDTLAAIDGRTIHTFHTEGAGGGHAPDIIRVASAINVLPSWTNPTLPYGINSQAELFDMIMICHNLNPKIPSDVAFCESRVRAETMACENVLHDIGALSILSSDSQAMGRVGESWLRAIQTADAMKKSRGKLPDDNPHNDNHRVLRYVAKITINPAITQGVSHVVGSVEVGKLADLVLWEKAFFGAKPAMVIKGGVINWASMGDPNASLPTTQPLFYRPMFGAYGLAVSQTCITFMSRLGVENDVRKKLGLQRPVMAVKHTRTITKKDMILNSATPEIIVNPETFAVIVDGVHATVPPLRDISMNQLYF